MTTEVLVTVKLTVEHLDDQAPEDVLHGVATEFVNEGDVLLGSIETGNFIEDWEVDFSLGGTAVP